MRYDRKAPRLVLRMPGGSNLRSKAGCRSFTNSLLFVGKLPATAVESEFESVVREGLREPWYAARLSMAADPTVTMNEEIATENASFLANEKNKS